MSYWLLLLLPSETQLPAAKVVRTAVIYQLPCELLD